MRGRQVAAVGAEAEDGDLAIAPGLEAVDLRIVGDAVDLDRPVPEPQRIAGHGGIEGDQDHSRRTADDPAGRPQVGEGHAGDGLVAEQVEAVGRQVQLPRDARSPGPGRPGSRTAGRRDG